MNFFEKVHRRLLRLRLRPIRVFCIHQVGDVFNPLTTYKCDWISTEAFKASIRNLKKEYTFISLPEAVNKLQNDSFRRGKFAVLTADDGYRCVLDVLPWLEQNNIPVTLFLNARYLDGQSCSPHILRLARKTDDGISEKEVSQDLYLTETMLKKMRTGMVSFASHGYEHLNATKLNPEEFVDQIQKNVAFLKRYEGYIPFHAYTWGKHDARKDTALKSMGIVPVYMDGQKNYNDAEAIHRELLPLANKNVYK